MASDPKLVDKIRNGSGGLIVSAVMVVIFALMIGEAIQLRPGARFAPLVVGIPALIMALVQLAAEVRALASRPRQTADRTSRPRLARRQEETRNALILMGWFTALVMLTVLLGVLIAFSVIVFGFLWQNQKDRLGVAVAIAAGFTATIYGVFDQLMGLRLWTGVVPPVFW